MSVPDACGLFHDSPSKDPGRGRPARTARRTQALIEKAAKTAHEVNRAYCESVGDTSQVPWEKAPQWQRDSAIAGVQAIAADPSTTPEQSHAGWLEQKRRDGWCFGKIKDAEAKTHPCMVDYAELPLEQRAKDKLFTVAVRAVLGLD